MYKNYHFFYQIQLYIKEDATFSTVNVNYIIYFFISPIYIQHSIYQINLLYLYYYLYKSVIFN